MSESENNNMIIFGCKNNKLSINYFCETTLVDYLSILFSIYNPENLDLLSELASRTIIRNVYKK